MCAKPIKAFQVNVQVKKMLTEKGIDTSKLTISTMGTSVYLRGKLEFIHETYTKDGAYHQWKTRRIKFLRELEKDIRKIRGVRFVRFQLHDWEKDGTTWVERRY